MRPFLLALLVLAPLAFLGTLEERYAQAAEAGHPRIARSAAAVAAFKRTHACPATGVAAAKPCHGYVVDHVVPLCAGGADHPSNMQWQALADSKVKDRQEDRLCALRARLRRAIRASDAAAFLAVEKQLHAMSTDITLPQAMRQTAADLHDQGAADMGRAR